MSLRTLMFPSSTIGNVGGADGATIGRKLIRPAVGVNTLANDMKILKVWLKQSYLDGMHDNRIWQRREMQKSFVTPERPRLSLDELKKLEVALETV